MVGICLDGMKCREKKGSDLEVILCLDNKLRGERFERKRFRGIK